MIPESHAETGGTKRAMPTCDGLIDAASPGSTFGETPAFGRIRPLSLCRSWKFATAFASSSAARMPVRQHGGCDFAERPDVPATSARLFWHEALDSGVLQVSAGSVRSVAVSFDVRLFSRQALVLADDHAERLSLSDGSCRIRLDVMDGTLLAGPVSLRFNIDDDVRTPVQLHALAQFRAFRRCGAFGR